METERQNVPILNEGERSAVKTVLYGIVKHEAVTAYLYDYPDNRVRLIGKQIDHEQQVVRSALRRNAICLSIAMEPCYLGAVFHLPEIFELRRQNTLFQRRNQELDQLWQKEDERLRTKAGVKWEDLDEVVADLGYSPLSGFTRKREHGLHSLESQSGGVSVKVYGNTILLPSYPDTVFSEASERLGIQDQISRQPIYGGRTDDPTPLYRLVVPYKNWIIATQPLPDYLGKYPDDPNYKPAYWSGLLIPTHEEVVAWVAAPYLHREG